MIWFVDRVSLLIEASYDVVVMVVLLVRYSTLFRSVGKKWHDE